jgi:ribosomal protein S18 acetylase RimI-like enzyme
MEDSGFHIRRATEDDAIGIAAVMRRVIAERIHSAIDVAWNVEEQTRYLRSLSTREAVHVAIIGSGVIVGLQTLDLRAPSISSMHHVAQAGTFLMPEWRGQGIGNALFRITERFAGEAGYVKIVIQVRGSNASARRFYRKLGFRECGRLSRQVRIDGAEDDEILMELFLS